MGPFVAAVRQATEFAINIFAAGAHCFSAGYSRCDRDDDGEELEVIGMAYILVYTYVYMYFVGLLGCTL